MRSVLDPNKTVRELALAIPNATRVFEQTRIDYCCGGDRLLSEACQTAGVDLGELQQLFDTTAEPTAGTLDFSAMSLAELITHILDTHHVFTKSEMERLQTLTAKVLAAHGANHPELSHLSDLLRDLFDELKQHMFKEEHILFPLIIEMEQAALQNRPIPFAPFGSVNNPIGMMMFEHDSAGETLRALRRLTADYAVPQDACASYQALYEGLEGFEQDLHQHIHLENNMLFPKAVQVEQAAQAQLQD